MWLMRKHILAIECFELLIENSICSLDLGNKRKWLDKLMVMLVLVEHNLACEQTEMEKLLYEQGQGQVRKEACELFFLRMKQA